LFWDCEVISLISVKVIKVTSLISVKVIKVTSLISVKVIKIILQNVADNGH
jgi:hypothetical protein